MALDVYFETVTVPRDLEENTQGKGQAIPKCLSVPQKGEKEIDLHAQIQSQFFLIFNSNCWPKN